MFSNLVPQLMRIVDICIRPIFWVFAVVLGVLILNVGFNHGEDMYTLYFTQSHSIIELLTSPYLGQTGTPAYRPVVVLIQKLLLETFNYHFIPVRAFFVIGFGIFMWQLNTLLRSFNISQTARYTSLLYVLSATYLFSPKITIGYTGGVLLLIIFTALFQYACRTELSTKDLVIMTGLTIFAPFCMETGVLCYVITGITLLKHRRWEFFIPLLVGFGSYFMFRAHILDAITATRRFPRASGFWFQHLEPEELEALFEGKSGLPYYIYTSLAQVLSLFTSQPAFGQFTLTPNFPLKLFRVFLSPLSTLVLIVAFRHSFRKHPWPWLLSGAIILSNTVLSFSYARPRIMMLSAVCYAILLGISLHTVWIEPVKHWVKLISLVVIFGWVVHYGNISIRMASIIQFITNAYTTTSTLEAPKNEIYQHVRQHYFLRL